MRYVLKRILVCATRFLHVCKRCAAPVFSTVECDEITFSFDARQYFYCKQCTCKLPRDYNNLRNTWRVPKLSTISPVKLKKKLFEPQITWLFFPSTKLSRSNQSEAKSILLFTRFHLGPLRSCSRKFQAKTPAREIKVHWICYLLFDVCLPSCLHKKSNRAYVSTSALMQNRSF